MNDLSQAPVETPQLRTLLLTDLCDSTRIIEKLGDARAAELFRDHDRLVLRLQQRWRGRLIDRSDGLLLLFERPIDGLGFALDYERGLCELGTERRIVLTARAGLHVGEVLTWRNSDEAVRVGSKPLEVEGIAKPFAARLMAMARPGQILLSAVAEPLAYRAARELGERSERLVWKHHGRWVFKGVPGTQEIFEVGEPGIAPLRAPPSSAKAWRAIPLWRRPAALAAEVALLAGIAAGTWFALRPQPAIAFGERDWVVVGDLRNLTGQSVLDDSLEQAFRISLEQSRYVNVLSDLKARDTLTRMRRPPDAALDRETASEIALRDGARAVIMPTVAEVGGRLRVSVELVDPHTQTTVYAESADGAGVDSALRSIDTLTTSLRGELGEAMRAIELNSAPLPQVSTSNLDALRAYALAEQAYARREYAEAARFYRHATELDPTFALAWIGRMRVSYAQVDAPGGVASLRQAQKLRSRLPPKEAMYLDAWVARFDWPAKATARWVELAKLYPDYGSAQSNAAMWLFVDNRFRESLAFAQAAAVPQNPTIAIDLDMIGRAQLALGRYDAAAEAFDRAIALGFASSLRRRAGTDAARGNFAAAEALIGRLPDTDRHAFQERTSIAIDQGDWSAARRYARQGLRIAEANGGFDSRSYLLPLAVAEWRSGRRAAAMANARAAAARALASLRGTQGVGADAEDDAVLALAAGLLTARLGDRATAAQVLDRLQAHPEVMSTPAASEFRTIVEAHVARLAGDPERALELLQPLVASQRERVQTRVALRQAYEDLGDQDKAQAQARWLRTHRGQAYIELQCGYCLQALNVADSSAKGAGR